MTRRVAMSKLLLWIMSALPLAASQAATPVCYSESGYGGALGFGFGYGGPLGCNAYIANYSSNTVSIVDLRNNTVARTIYVGQGPDGVAVSKDAKRVYVANYASDSVSVIDGEWNWVIGTIPIQSRPYGIAVSPDGSRVYVTAYYTNTVSIIDTTSLTVIGTIPVGNRPEGIVVNWDGSRVYVANYADNSISVIDTATRKVITKVQLPAGTNPMGLAISADGGRVYATGYSNNKLFEINTATNKINATIPVGSHPSGLGLSPNQKVVYVANYGGVGATGSVSAIDTTDNYAVETLPLPAGAYPVAVTARADGRGVFVTSYSNNSVYVINQYGMYIRETLSVGSRPSGQGVFMMPPDPSAWDTTPPVIELTPIAPTPPNGLPTIVRADSPLTFAASYSNPDTGIVVSGIRVLFDGIDVTADARITASGLEYSPGVVAAGDHSVIVRVPDKYGLYAEDGWFFYTSDGPAIDNVSPQPNVVLAAGESPTVMADFRDRGAYIDCYTGLRLTVDGVDVTSAMYVPSGCYTGSWATLIYPAGRMKPGNHSVTLNVENPIGMSATKTWSFSIASGLSASFQAPAPGITTDPFALIRASFSDAAGVIDKAKTILIVDGINVTSQAIVSDTSITYSPPVPWSVGAHTATLTLIDNQDDTITVSRAFTFSAGPRIYDETPRDSFVAVPNPMIRVLVEDVGSGINVGATRISIDGVDVTAAATVSATEITVLASGLAPGVHSVRLDAQSAAGQASSKEWKFTVIAVPPPTTTADGVRTPRSVPPRVAIPE